MRRILLSGVVLFVALMPLAMYGATGRRSPVSLGVKVLGSHLEGNSGITTTFVQYDLGPNADPIHPDITGDYQTVDGTATVADNDYHATSGKFSIPNGQTKSQLLPVEIVGDLRFENDETFTVEASNVQNAGTPAPVSITIVNDDVPVVTVSNAQAAEGLTGTTNMTFTVTMTPPAGVTVLVAYATSNGTATAGQDYQATSGTLSFATNDATKTVLVVINGDATVEPDETFTLTATPAGGVAATGTGTILNDDQPPLTKVAVISGNGQIGRLGCPLAQPLIVEVQNSLGGPVPGVVVQWTVTKGTAQLGASSSTTNAQGRASNTVTVTSVGTVEVQATVPLLPAAIFTFASQTAFADRAQGPVAVPIARALDKICAKNQTVFDDACRAISRLDDSTLTPVLEHVAPQQSGAQSKVASAAVSYVAAGIGSRLAALRNGAEGFSISKLSLSIDSKPLPLGSMASAFLPQTTTAAAASEEKDYNGWSGFLSGNLGSGERIGHDGQLGFDLRSSGIMAGVDRQFGASVFGVSLNLMKLKSTLTDSTGSLDTNGYAMSIYGSRNGLFAGNAAPAAGSGKHYDGVHIDGSLTIGRNRYDAEHIVDIPTLPSSIARSKNNANVFALTGGTGIEAHQGRTDYDFSISGTWSRADISDLTENGNGPLILFVEGHAIDSAVATAGFNMRSAFPVSFGNLLPSFRAELIHEFRGGPRLITARFIKDSDNTNSFTIPLDQPDTNYAKISAGIQAVFPRGVSAFLEATQDVLRSDLHYHTIQLNVSKSF